MGTVHECDRQTDGQTDGQIYDKPALCIASHGINAAIVNKRFTTFVKSVFHSY